MGLNLKDEAAAEVLHVFLVNRKRRETLRQAIGQFAHKNSAVKAAK
jgi:hypothetical protein